MKKSIVILSRKFKYKISNYKMEIHNFIESICQKHFKLDTKTYKFRKWLYVKFWNLDVCHFCLVHCTDYYCPECLAETD